MHSFADFPERGSAVCVKLTVTSLLRANFLSSPVSQSTKEVSMLAHLSPKNCKIKQQLDHHRGTHQIRVCHEYPCLCVCVCVEHILAPAVAPKLWASVWARIPVPGWKHSLLCEMRWCAWLYGKNPRFPVSSHCTKCNCLFLGVILG